MAVTYGVGALFGTAVSLAAEASGTNARMRTRKHQVSALPYSNRLHLKALHAISFFKAAPSFPMSTSTLASDGVHLATTYDAPGKAFHWAVVALVACQSGTALLLPHIELDTPLGTTINLHFNFGLVILVVMAARLVHRWMHPVAVAPGDSPSWERTLALATHRLFYAILLMGPFLGWTAASAHGVPVRLFGVFTLPDLAPRKAEWGFLAGDIHGYTMWMTLLALIGIHAAGAL